MPHGLLYVDSVLLRGRWELFLVKASLARSVVEFEIGNQNPRLPLPGMGEVFEFCTQ